jgi:hexosaminidase
MHRILLFVLILSPIFTFCQKPGRVHIVPEPVSVASKTGSFLLNATTKIIFPAGNSEMQLAADYLAGMLSTSTGYKLVSIASNAKTKTEKKNCISFKLDTKAVKQPEGYQLEVGTTGITVTAGSGAGAFYAVQTIRQLFPAAISSSTVQTGVDWAAQACSITDYPRFGYRGMMLDVSRHWFPVSFVKRYIDLLAIHKMNRFHWHLTDDQGWRIEIKKYPKLAKVAACRSQTLSGHYSDVPELYDGVPYCHIYSQEEVKEIVAYANARFVTIVPEIEMPGHALAALAAYPELGCDGAGYSTATKWGVIEDVFCAGNDQVFTFIEDVFNEVCPLFPGEYVHVGGDECPKTKWKECGRCQDRMRKEGLKDEHELQSYVIQRAEVMLAKHGKKLIGWDEILEGGLSPNATVMSWRGIEGGIAAVKANHDAIMTPTSYCYLDYYQSDPNSEPLAIGGLLTLEKVYGYEPIPEGLTAPQAAHILGVQANIWTEYIASPSYLDYMAYPRACALAEVAWTAKAQRNWDNFRSKMVVHLARLDAMKVNYAKSFYDIKATYSGGLVSLACGDPTAQIRYSNNGNEPTGESPIYTAPFALAKTTAVKAAAWRGGKPLGKTMVANYLVHKASGKSYTMSKDPSKFKGSNTYSLTDGVVGGMKTWDDWVGLVNHNIDPVIDLGEVMPINRVATNYLNNKPSYIFPPRSIEVFISDDGKNFKSVGKKMINTDEKMNNSIEGVNISTPKAKGRYVKLVATTFGIIPEGHPGAKEGAWLFIDEVIVE